MPAISTGIWMSLKQMWSGGWQKSAALPGPALVHITSVAWGDRTDRRWLCPRVCCRSGSAFPLRVRTVARRAAAVMLLVSTVMVLVPCIVAVDGTACGITQPATSLDGWNASGHGSWDPVPETAEIQFRKPNQVPHTLLSYVAVP